MENVCCLSKSGIKKIALINHIIFKNPIANKIGRISISKIFNLNIPHAQKGNINLMFTMSLYELCAKAKNQK